MSKKKSDQIEPDDVLRFPIVGNLLRSHIQGAFKQERKLRGHGGRHVAVFHFTGSQCAIRQQLNWEVRRVEGPESRKGKILHHFLCTPTGRTSTADAFRLSNGQVVFSKQPRRNGGPENAGAPVRPSVASVI